MAKDSVKLLLLAGMISFAVLYGMELSSRGIHKVYGPLDPSQTQQPAQVPAKGEEIWRLPPSGDGNGVLSESPAEPIPSSGRKPMVDRVSGTAAETLHRLSSGGMRFVVSLFDRVTGS
jgi:hypothetical protein